MTAFIPKVSTVFVILFLAVTTCFALKCYQCVTEDECAGNVKSMEVVDNCQASGDLTAFCVKHTYIKDNRKVGTKAGEVQMRQCASAEGDTYEAGKCYEDTYNVNSCYCDKDLCNK